MTRPYGAVMPVHAPHQKHADAKHSDNYGFLRSLTGHEYADVNYRVAWNDHTRRTMAAGVTVFGLHGDTPASNGYRWIMRRGRCRPMTHAELHRPLGEWDAADVTRWRRGRTRFSARPRTLRQLLNYVRKHGGTIIGELKDPLFRIEWIMQLVVAEYRRADHAAWFKALINMKFCREKNNATQKAGGQFAIIFGTHREYARKPPADWAAWEMDPTRIWGPASHWPLGPARTGAR